MTMTNSCSTTRACKFVISQIIVCSLYCSVFFVHYWSISGADPGVSEHRIMGPLKDRPGGGKRTFWGFFILKQKKLRF